MRSLLAFVFAATVFAAGYCGDSEVVPRIRCDDLDVGQVGLITFDGTNPVHAKAIQVIDDNTAIMEWSRTLHWVEMPTLGMVNGKTYKMDKVMRVTGTKRYTTVLGAQRTILALEAIGEVDWAAENKKAAEVAAERLHARKLNAAYESGEEAGFDAVSNFQWHKVRVPQKLVDKKRAEAVKAKGLKDEAEVAEFERGFDAAVAEQRKK